MAKKYYEGTDYNINTDWGGDETTGGLPLPGSAVQDIVKTNINELHNKKIGYVAKGEGFDNNMVFFYSEKNGEILGEFKLEPLYSINVKPDNQNRPLFFTGENDKKFIWYFKTIKISDGSRYDENVSVTYKVFTGGSNKTYELILDIKKLTLTEEGYKVELDLNQYLVEGTSKIEIIIKGLVTKQVANIPSKEIQITKFDVLDRTNFSVPFTKTININASVDCVGGFNFYYRFDEVGDYILFTKYDSGVENISPKIDVTGLTNDFHVIEYKIGLEINGQRRFSNVQRIEFVKKDENVVLTDLFLLTQMADYSSVNGIITLSNIYTYTNYNLRCAVFNNNSESVAVTVMEGDTELINRNIEPEEVIDLTFNFEIEGPKEITFYLRYGEKELKRVIYFNVKSLDIDIQLYNHELVIDFDSSTKIGDNSVDTREKWENKVIKNIDIKPEFNKDFIWSEGWSKNGLVITNGSELSFNYAPFPGSKGSYIVGDNGNDYTIEIEFMTQNVTNEDDTLCDMANSNCGLLITASEIKFKITDGEEVGTRFNPNELNHCVIVIRNTKNSKGSFRGLVELYINGVICGISAFEKPTKFIVSDDLVDRKLKFSGAKGADFVLKRIRTYNSAPVNRDSIVNNFILQRTSGNEIMSLYKKNLISDENGNITPETVAQLGNIPILIFIGRTDGNGLATGDGNETGDEPYIKGNINVQNEYWYETLEKTKDKNKEIEMDVVYYDPEDKTKNFKFVKARVRPQGTSSMLYPRKNFRIYTQKTNDTRCFFSTEDSNLELTDMLRSDFGENEADRDWEKYRGRKNYKKRKYSFKDGAQPVKCWCLKADFAETSSSHNTGVARLWNDVMKKSTVDGKHIFKTNAQEIAEKYNYKYDVRTTIDGFPIIVFGKRCYSDIYPELDENGNEIKTPYVLLGKYNFNNDKSTESVFGFCDIDNNTGHTIPRKGVNYSEPGYEVYDELSEDKQKELENGLIEEYFTLDAMLDKYMCCVETLDNGNILGNFGSMESEDNKPWDESWDKAFEFRYQEIPEEPKKSDYQDENGNWGGKEGDYEDYIKDLEEYNENLPKWKNTRLKPFKHFAKWLYDTRWCDINGNILPGISNEEAMIRKDKFAKEKWLHLDVWKVAAYYVYAMRFGAVDQLVKNSMLTSEGPFAYDAKLQKKGYWDYTPEDHANYGKYYKWYFINYDNDTILGLRNDGDLVYDPYITRQSTEGSGIAKTPIYAGSESTLWNNLENDDEFKNILRKVDQSLSENLNYTNTINMFNIKQVGEWCERFYNKDAEYKYILPYLGDWKYDENEDSKDSLVNKLFMLQGSRTAHRKWWLTRRFDLFDGRWGSGGFEKKYIGVKCNAALIGDKFEAVAANNGYFGYTINGQTFKGGETISYNKDARIIWELRKNLNIGDPVAIYNPQNISELRLGDISKYLTEITFTFNGAENNLKVLDLGISENLLANKSFYYDIFSDITLGDNNGWKSFKEEISFDGEEDDYSGATEDVIIKDATDETPDVYRLEIKYGEENKETTYSYFIKRQGYFRNYSLNNGNISFNGLDKLQDLKLTGYASLTKVSLTDSQTIKNVDTRYSSISTINFAENAQIETISASSALTELVFNGCNNIKFSGITIDEKTLDKSNNILNINIKNSTTLTNNEEFKNFILKWAKDNVNNYAAKLILHDINWTGINIEDLKILYYYLEKRQNSSEVDFSGNLILGPTSITNEDLSLINKLENCSKAKVVIPFTYISANISGTSSATIVAGENTYIDFHVIGNSNNTGFSYRCVIVEEIINYAGEEYYISSNGKYYKKIDTSEYRGESGITITKHESENKFEVKTNEIICYSDTDVKLAVIGMDKDGNEVFDIVALKILDPTYPYEINIIGNRSINKTGSKTYELSLLTDKNTKPNSNIDVTWTLSGDVSDYINIDEYTKTDDGTYLIKKDKFKNANKIEIECKELPNNIVVASEFYLQINVEYTKTIKGDEVNSTKENVILSKKYMILSEEVILTNISNPVVFNICQEAEWVQKDTTYMTKADALKVRDIGEYFANKIDADWTFEEFEYFTKVKEIPISAFYGSNIIRINLPSTIDKIGECAFENCEKLENVNFNNCGITVIPERMFFNNKNITNVYLPSSVEEIGAFAFGNANIEKICDSNSTPSNSKKTIYLQRVGDVFSLKYIRNNAFECEDITLTGQKKGTDVLNKSTNVLNEIFLPNNLKIEKFAYNFLSSKKLTNIKTQSNNKFVFENNILYNNSKKTIIYRVVDCNIKLELNGVKTIYPFAFAYNQNEYEIIGDKFITEIGEGCFYESNITTINLKNCVDLKTLDSYTFYNCNLLTQIELPDGLKTLGYRLFDGCTNLREIKLPNTIDECMEIDYFGYQFNNCGITTLTIPDNLRQVPFYFVRNCSEIKEIRFSKYYNLSHSNNHQLFVNCGNLTTVYLPLFSKNINDNEYEIINNLFYSKGSSETFKDCNSINKFVLHENDNRLIMTTEDDGISIIRVGNGNLSNNTITQCEPKLVKVVYSATEYKLPEDVKEIENGAFANCGNLNNVTLNDVLEIIGSYAFAGCNNLSSVKLNNVLETISSYAFASCGKLESINLPNTLTSIGESAFRGCGLKEIIIPENVTNISRHTFYECSKLEIIKILSQELLTINEFAFVYCSNLKEILILSSNAPELKTGTKYYTDYGAIENVNIYEYHPFGYNEFTIVGSNINEDKKLFLPNNNYGYDTEKWIYPLSAVCNFEFIPIIIENDIAIVDESLNNMDMVYIKRETNDNIEPLAVLSPYNEGDSKRIVMFNSEKIYHGETIVVYSDEECNNEIGKFEAKYGKDVYNLTKEIVMGSTYSKSLFNTNIFEDEKVVENNNMTEMANITKHEYNLLLAKVNQLMKLLNKKK